MPEESTPARATSAWLDAMLNDLARSGSLRIEGEQVVNLDRIRSEIQHQQRRPGARAAGRELVVGGLLFGRQVQVAVIRLAFEHTGQAGAADALLAGGLHLHAGIGQGLHHRLLGGTSTMLPELASLT